MSACFCTPKSVCSEVRGRCLLSVQWWSPGTCLLPLPISSNPFPLNEDRVGSGAGAMGRAQDGRPDLLHSSCVTRDKLLSKHNDLNTSSVSLSKDTGETMWRRPCTQLTHSSHTLTHTGWDLWRWHCPDSSSYTTPGIRADTCEAETSPVTLQDQWDSMGR